MEQEFAQIWQRLEADRQAGRLDDDDKDKDEETLKADYRAIAERRVRLGLLLAEIGRANSITVAAGRDDPGDADGGDALSGAGTAGHGVLPPEPAGHRDAAGPTFEEKVVDFVLELAKVEEKTVTPEELAELPPVAQEAAAGQARPRPPPNPLPHGAG